MSDVEFDIESFDVVIIQDNIAHTDVNLTSENDLGKETVVDHKLVKYIYDVEFVIDHILTFDTNKSIKLGKIQLKNKREYWLDKKCQFAAVKFKPSNIQYIDIITTATASVDHESDKKELVVVTYVPSESEAILYCAILHDPQSLLYIESQTYQLALEAVKLDKSVMQFVKDEFKEKIQEQLGL